MTYPGGVGDDDPEFLVEQTNAVRKVGDEVSELGFSLDQGPVLVLQLLKILHSGYAQGEDVGDLRQHFQVRDREGSSYGAVE